MAITSLIINPGSTSTKLGIFEDETLIMDETLRHSTEEIAQYATIIDQKDFRKNIILCHCKIKKYLVVIKKFVLLHSRFDVTIENRDRGQKRGKRSSLTLRKPKKLAKSVSSQ